MNGGGEWLILFDRLTKREDRVKAILLHNPHAQIRIHDLPGGGVLLVFVHGLGCASSCDYPRIVHDPASLTAAHPLFQGLESDPKEFN